MMILCKNANGSDGLEFMETNISFIYQSAPHSRSGKREYHGRGNVPTQSWRAIVAQTTSQRSIVVNRQFFNKISRSFKSLYGDLDTCHHRQLRIPYKIDEINRIS